MNRILIILLFAAALCLTALTACAAKSGGAPAAETPAPEAVPEPSPAPEPTDEPPSGPSPLEIATRQGSVKAWLGSYSWERELGGGVSHGVEADAADPPAYRLRRQAGRCGHRPLLTQECKTAL